MLNKIKYIYISLLLCLLISDDSSRFNLIQNISNDFYLEFDLDNVQLEKNNEFSKIETDLKTGNTGVIGMPKLPSYSTLIMIDPTKSYRLEYSIKESYIVDDIKIAPNQHLVDGLEKSYVEDIDDNFYNSKTKYPYNNVTVSDPLIMRDLVVLNLSVVPFNFIPNRRQLEVITSFDIRLIETDTHEDIRRRQMPKSRVFEKLYQNQIINYNSETRDDEYQHPSILYICAGNLETNSTLGQLFQWREERGYIVYTASLSETGSSATSIKNYIENAYDTFNPPPEYVALVGDVGGSYSIPTYYEDFGHDSYGNECEGDLPYSQLDGSDLFPEVIVGRMSLRSTSELNAVVPKILNYEKATYLGNLDNYYNNASMAGDPSSSGNSCAITKEYVKEILENHGFGDVDIKTSGSSWSSWMRNELSDGTLFFNYRGYLGMSGFSTGDIDDASNGYKLPFATVLTCGTGSFAEDQTSMSEKFFRAGSSSNPKGGVAAVGTATWNTHTLFNNIVDMGMYDGLLADKVETAGAALASGKLALYNAYSNDPYEWIDAFTQWNNLMGDPATHLWTDTPIVISVSHPSSIPYGTNYLDVIVVGPSGLPIEGALVSIEERNVPTNIYTDGTGSARFYLGDMTTGNTLITITKLNHKPYQGYVNILTNENLNVNIDHSQDILISDSLDGNSGIIESGETVGLSIPIENLGNQTVTGVYAVLSSTSDYVTVIDNNVTYGTVQSGESIYGDNFNISISPAAIQGEDLELLLNIYDSQSNNWISLVLVDVMGSHLIPASTINIQPGQTNSVNIDLRNFGSLLESGVSAELSYSGNLVTINDSQGTWGTISPGEQATSVNGFNLTLSNDIINGTQIPLSIHIQSSEGYNRMEIVNLQAGDVSQVDPLGPDQYGYYIYDSGDEEYSLSPTYNWIDIENTGTNLNLSDSGNGNWSGNGPIETINIPFDFTFYGISYDEITVCTNGWISPGSSNMESFRNYQIPGAGGPSPMIAAFWDDLETGNNGDVYYQAFNDYVVVQWQDMRTQNNNSLETFQVILYNNSVQPYGDNEIKIQYQEFNNTSSGSFSSYPPIHGAYATIGLENHLGDDGLQYTFLNQYPSAAMTLTDNTALFITTQPSITLPSAELNVSANNFDFQLEYGQTQSSVLEISNSGEEGSELSYIVSQSYPEMNSPFDVAGGGPDSYGFYWTDSGISNDLDYEFIDISSNGTQVSFTSNDIGTDMIDIGFEFLFYGETYSQFRINPNGWIGFEDDNTGWYNGNIPSPEYPRSAIFGFWDDLNPINDNCNSTCSGNVYYYSDGQKLVVWFNDVAHWASEGFENSFYNFQIVIHSDGEVDININNIEGIYSATVGLQNASGTTGIQVDEYNGDYFGNNQSFKFIRPYIPDWLSINSPQGLSGDLNEGESIDVNIEVNTSDATNGEYIASVLVSSNVQDTIEIPISLTVADMGIIGDVNGDGSINVLDIVAVVNIILGGGTDYNPSADINQDGTIDVLDVVTLVTSILDE